MRHLENKPLYGERERERERKRDRESECVRVNLFVNLKSVNCSFALIPSLF